MKHSIRFNFKLLSAISLISFFSYSCQAPQASEKDQELGKLKYSEKVIEVNAQEVQRAVFSREILANGVLSPCKKSKLVFKLNENIAEVYVKNGQVIQQDQVLVRLEDFNQKIDLEKAKNSLLKAEIELKDILFAHSPDLTDTSKINPKVMETARSRSGYTDALIALRQTEYNLAHTVIKAPFDGVISDIQVKENNNSGNYDFFACALDNRQMELEFGLMESELDMLSLGANVIVVPYAFTKKEFKGTISEINPAVDESGMIKVKAIIPNLEGVLLDGMNAEVIVRKEIPNQLVVPKEAVLLRQERQMLFTLKDDSIAQWVYIKTGLENSSQFTITEGINEGDIIIVNNNFNLGHEVVVRARILN